MQYVFAYLRKHDVIVDFGVCGHICIDIQCNLVDCVYLFDLEWFRYQSALVYESQLAYIDVSCSKAIDSGVVSSFIRFGFSSLSLMYCIGIASKSHLVAPLTSTVRWFSFRGNS